jgi:hypothetical protein
MLIFCVRSAATEYLSVFCQISHHQSGKAGNAVSHESRIKILEVECDQQDLCKADDREVAAILREFEGCGDAMRCLNRQGQLMWKASPQMVERLADAEKEAEAEWENER